MAEAAKKMDLPAKAEPTVSERFTGMVIRELASTVGTDVQISEEQRRLAQHLFVKIDATLNALEVKRAKEDSKGTPMTWANVNMQKLALDAMHRIELGLDALCPNHIHPIPYLNKRTGKYDLDLRIGYMGKDFYRRKVAVSEPKDIIYELVYETDQFVAHKKSINRDIESFEFVITEPFQRGEIVGGFGYIVYDDPTKNKLIIVSEKDFLKSKKIAKSTNFWTDNPAEMRFKTLVHRVTDKLNIDPAKVNVSFATVEAQEAEAEIEREIEENANTGTVIDVQAEPETTAGGDGMTEEEKQQAIEREKAEAAAEAAKNGKRSPGF